MLHLSAFSSVFIPIHTWNITIRITILAPVFTITVIITMLTFHRWITWMCSLLLHNHSLHINVTHPYSHCLVSVMFSVHLCSCCCLDSNSPRLPFPCVYSSCAFRSLFPLCIPLLSIKDNSTPGLHSGSHRIRIIFKRF